MISFNTLPIIVHNIFEIFNHIASKYSVRFAMLRQTKESYMRNMRLAGVIDKQKCFSFVGYMLLNHLLFYYIKCNECHRYTTPNDDHIIAFYQIFWYIYKHTV